MSTSKDEDRAEKIDGMSQSKQIKDKSPAKKEAKRTSKEPTVRVPELHFNYSWLKYLKDNNLISASVERWNHYVMKWKVSITLEVVKHIMDWPIREIEGAGKAFEMTKQVGPKWKDDMKIAFLQDILRPFWWFYNKKGEVYEPYKFESYFMGMNLLQGSRMLLDMVFCTYAHSDLGQFGTLETLITLDPSVYAAFKTDKELGPMIDKLEKSPRPFGNSRYDNLIKAASRFMPNLTFRPYKPGETLPYIPCIGDLFYRRYSVTGVITVMKLISERSNLISMAFNILWNVSTPDDYERPDSNIIDLNDLGEDVTSKQLDDLYREYKKLKFRLFSNAIAELYTGVKTSGPAIEDSWSGEPGGEIPSERPTRPSGSGSGPRTGSTRPQISTDFEEQPSEVSDSITAEEFRALSEDSVAQARETNALLTTAKELISQGATAAAGQVLDAGIGRVAAIGLGMIMKRPQLVSAAKAIIRGSRNVNIKGLLPSPS